MDFFRWRIERRTNVSRENNELQYDCQLAHKASVDVTGCPVHRNIPTISFTHATDEITALFRIVKGKGGRVGCAVELCDQFAYSEVKDFYAVECVYEVDLLLHLVLVPA
ncbi:unnamed protein product [Strongylus vulgaris]|uniref:Uncharacterized protein n=1 Tax=Strongylus vulgaris TaxID=40348 RepID=A0A3P7L7Y1_STRVU|nr:unnamed protein product [Strongylus vulgaris]